MKPPSTDFSARMADGIRRQGFRAWFSRELLSGHAHTLLALLSLAALLASLNAWAGTPDKWLNAGLAVASAAICVGAARRMGALLLRAEGLSRQAGCPRCGEYGRFDLQHLDRATGQARVRCRRCAGAWLIRTD